jgi:hypothetical protein
MPASVLTPSAHLLSVKVERSLAAGFRFAFIHVALPRE